jgi:nitrogen fixation/metabolism regulation signal transduction histidine kinase
MSAMKMRQSLAQLEQEFLQQTEVEEQRRKHMQRTAAARSRQRWHARERKRGSMRFYVLAVSLILTAVLVTVAMFTTLYFLLA